MSVDPVQRSLISFEAMGVTVRPVGTEGGVVSEVVGVVGVIVWVGVRVVVVVVVGAGVGVDVGGGVVVTGEPFVG